MNRPTSPEDVQKVFDCYCKKILKNEAINIQKHYQHLNDVQVSFSELTPEQLAELATYIARLSMRTSIDEYGNPHTTVDEDMRSRLEAKLIEQVLNFKVA